MTTTETKTRNEAPLVALVLGAVALIAGFIATTPGIPLIAGTIAVIAAAVDITKRHGVNWMTAVGLAAAVVGIIVSIITTSA